MIGSRPIVTFDTSAHNRLAEGGPISEAILAGIKSGMSFRFAGLSIDEIVSCPDPEKRAMILTFCARLQLGCSDSIYPPNELIRNLIVAHFEQPGEFDWRNVDVRAREYERGIQRRQVLLDSQLSIEQRREQHAQQKQYQQMFAGIRPEIEGVFVASGERAPLKFRDVVNRLQLGEGPLIWQMGKLLYDRAAETDASEAAINGFMQHCPPFRALIYAMLMSWYDLAVRDKHAGERFRAGRNDLFMSVYLPYCDTFITAESKGEQERCLREVASVAGIDSEIVSYDHFFESFLVSPQNTPPV